MIKPINIFISYRRKDSKANARSLYQALKDDFEVFFDIDKENSISYGQIFPERIQYGIEKAEIFIPIIGKEFASELNNRKDKHDWVLEEILSAKALNKKFLPIFIDDAFMPNDGELDEKVEFIRAIDTFTLSHDKFEQDIETLKKIIRRKIYGRKKIKDEDKKNSSSKNIFEKLKNYLIIGNFEKANKETLNLFLTISKSEKLGWVKDKDIQNLPNDFILEINQLWRKYSGGIFCFSQQLDLMEEYEIDLHRPNAFMRFSKLVMWENTYIGNTSINGSFPTPLCSNQNLALNRNSFIGILKKFKISESSYLEENNSQEKELK
jgi:hypothetical protein